MYSCVYVVTAYELVVYKGHLCLMWSCESWSKIIYRYFTAVSRVMDLLSRMTGLLNFRVDLVNHMRQM